MMRQYELVERVRSYDPNADEDKLNRAYVFSMKAHGSQKRASGDPYFSHPLEVAGLLTQLKLDGASIITALLHDTVEDTLTTLEEVQRLFGPEIARLVDGVTKLSRIELQNLESDQSKQAENFRKLVLAMSEDIRVLLVKLADRLHNMQTLHYLSKPEKRKRIARETLEIYAPLAERIGIQRWKDQLEELSFKELNPDAYDSITKRLQDLEEQGAGRVDRIIHELVDTLHENGLPQATVSGRRKAPYSIWRKMQRKNVTFEQLSDVMAFRITVESIEQCYQALGVIHARYPVVPGRFKDYVSTPKPNGYRSLHTTVIGPERQRIEVQIRTTEMHEVSELGVAAHWAYKSDGSSQPKTEGRQYRWLRELLDILEHAVRPEEFLEHTKLELFQDQVFCFTPKGDLIALPRGATPVDFAYAVHSQIGDTCVGAKINGRIQPLRSQLQNGDQVEVVTSKAQTPSPDWENFVVTGKARARIRRYIRTQQRAQHIELGRAMVQKIFRQEGYDYSDKALEGVLKIFQYQSADDLIAAIGAGLAGARDVFNAVFPGHKVVQQITPDEKIVQLTRGKTSKPKGKDSPLPIKGLIPGMAVHYARCCHPLPGDRIVGIVTTGKGVTIHTIDCETLESFHDSPERWIDVSWDNEADGADEKVGRITVVVANEPGSLGTVSTVIGKNGGNITNLKITHRTTDFFEMLIDIDVHDVKHLTNIIAALRATPVINSVDRARGR
ncbi:RelA/SpoT family protein [Nitrospirillum amazonense]|uniref:RelA/SpoT family protein n=1 Tax=Nitrospirillum amazonense TaxID=28077 RepID=UPI0024124632|nr:bifunctional (p)ppGpp synthetase/guanosine-3',5'-bis(diphosphate) 3'-pyrophosphohydrolase [Nitrospirillum amazonense]MDG3441484.1 bifunctional (p)ppGpp synthetase/guanosine-3',5'-bis(diphosphate) 3'-pyrophosphohydrolase [Nitrospirillum amazonense]